MDLGKPNSVRHIFPVHRTAHLTVNSHIMSFRFVENNNIDETTRKQIRSHVMKGKNAGKVRPRTRKEQGGQRHVDQNTTEESDGNSKVSVPRAVGNLFSTIAFPYELRPDMMNLLYKCADNRAVFRNLCIVLANSVQSGP